MNYQERFTEVIKTALSMSDRTNPIFSWSKRPRKVGLFHYVKDTGKNVSLSLYITYIKRYVCKEELEYKTIPLAKREWTLSVNKNGKLLLNGAPITIQQGLSKDIIIEWVYRLWYNMPDDLESMNEELKWLKRSLFLQIEGKSLEDHCSLYNIRYASSYTELSMKVSHLKRNKYYLPIGERIIRYLNVTVTNYRGITLVHKRNCSSIQSKILSNIELSYGKFPYEWNKHNVTVEDIFYAIFKEDLPEELENTLIKIGTHL